MCGWNVSSLALAYLKVVPNKYKISTATYFASLIDFEDPGELGIFITEEQITSIEQQMKKTGYFDGKDMAAAFNFLRPGDLYWNYVVNNYLLGNEPTAFVCFTGTLTQHDFLKRCTQNTCVACI